MKENKYGKLYMELDNEGAKIIVNDRVDMNTFNLQDYIFNHDYEAYSIVKFDLKVEGE